MNTSKRIAIVFFDAASGHRSSAVALQKMLHQRQPDWQVDLVNITEVFDHHPVFGWVVRTGINYFNWQIRRDIVFDLKGLINLSLLCHDLTFSRGIRKIARYWQASPPDAVISVTPMYNPVLYRSARIANPRVRCITIPVDFEEARPRYWFTPREEQYYLNATARLTDQAQAAGIAAPYLQALPGMIADPDSYVVPARNKALELKKLGLDPGLPTGFVSFGGQGSVKVSQIAAEISRQGLPVNMIYMCGRDAGLYRKLSALKTPYPKKVFSYLKETPVHYQHLADFAIGKPGAMTITEALITNTPLIAIKSTGMRPVQKGNEDWLTQAQVGLVAPDVKSLVPAINEVLQRPAYKQNMLRHRHQAIVEATDIIAAILNQ
jgi:glycosyltransferase involved in cell wall biosynthesis